MKQEMIRQTLSPLSTVFVSVQSSLQCVYMAHGNSQVIVVVVVV